MLQFESREAARAFAAEVTAAAMERFPGMELFVKCMDYDPGKGAGENLKELSRRLEEKKALRSGSFRRMSLGVEALGRELTGGGDREGFLPVRVRRPGEPKLPARPDYNFARLLPEPWERFPAAFDELTGPKDNFIAVVHIDGNAMGRRVEKVYETHGREWEDCVKALRGFSEGIQADFESAFRSVAQALADRLKGDGPWQKAFREEKSGEVKHLPIRPVILAGDDVCFVTAGSLGIHCARLFLEELKKRTNAVDGGTYPACAGVALVHRTYPFHQAYDLSEELCGSAKRFGAAFDGSGGVSAMDWHIEFGQLKDGLAWLRADYETEDGNRLELRPVAVSYPETLEARPHFARTWDFFQAMAGAMKGEAGKTARGKIKELRTAMKQGEVETAFFLRDQRIGDLVYHIAKAKGGSLSAMGREIRESGILRKEPFVRTEEDPEAPKRCLFFDAVEVLDHYINWEEAER